MKNFNIPLHYKSSIISQIKEIRKQRDPRKRDFAPTILNFGPVEFLIARHFGFCYGVENAIEIAYRTINENPGKRIFLLSEMIHNPGVNKDLLQKGVRFLMDTSGNQLISWEELNKEDIVIIPAFGTTIKIEKKIKELGINPYSYNTTCPFVEKVWNRATSLGAKDYTIIIHGKYNHEETKATFSHSIQNSASVIVRNIKEAQVLADIILGEQPLSYFFEYFNLKYSDGFNPEKNLQRIGVVNQTTMLASETQEISELIKEALIKKYGAEKISDHFADTRDTLCYATNDNQNATYGLLEHNADCAIVVGGYNSSNTSHLVELLEEKFKTYFICSSEKIISKDSVLHYDLKNKQEILSGEFLPFQNKSRIILTSGASCPDAAVDEVIFKILSFYKNTNDIGKVLNEISD